MTVDDKGIALSTAPDQEAMGKMSAASSHDVEKQVEHDYYCFGLYDCGPPPIQGWCGLEVEERPDFKWVRQDVWGLALPLFFGGVCGLASLYWAIFHFDEDLHVIRPPDLQDFVTGLGSGFAIMLMFYPLGIPVWYYGVSVAMSRKVSHVILMTLLPATAVVSSHGEGLGRDIFLSVTWASLFTCSVLSVIWLTPCRKYVHLFKISFASIERTEDRPLALLYVLMQSTAMTMVQTPMIQWMLAEDKGLLIFIPFLSVALGDGLAEPIGRMYGKHKYEVYGIGTNKKFTRSYEGSAVVFFFTLVAVLIALPEMNWLQAVLCILLIPAANTYAEARSPHTFDNHFMFGVTWILLVIIFDVVPEV